MAFIFIATKIDFGNFSLVFSFFTLCTHDAVFRGEYHDLRCARQRKKSLHHENISRFPFFLRIHVNRVFASAAFQSRKLNEIFFGGDDDVWKVHKRRRANESFSLPSPTSPLFIVGFLRTFIFQFAAVSLSSRSQKNFSSLVFLLQMTQRAERNSEKEIMLFNFLVSGPL
jgi:hypothetical protein